MTTYTIAYRLDDGFLIACVPDGEIIDNAISLDRDLCCVVSGLCLTDDEEPGDDVVYSCYPEGWLIDKSGRAFMLAVRR